MPAERWTKSTDTQIQWELENRLTFDSHTSETLMIELKSAQWDPYKRLILTEVLHYASEAQLVKAIKTLEDFYEYGLREYNRQEGF